MCCNHPSALKSVCSVYIFDSDGGGWNKEGKILMSLSYILAEKLCYSVKGITGNGLGGFIIKPAKNSNKKKEIPLCLKRRDLRVKRYEVGEFSIFRIRSRSRKTEEKRAVLFLPGGGGLASATFLHYDTARKIAANTGADVFIANYPLAPEHNARYALEWLEKVYHTLLKHYEAKDITFMGDSAGANLCLSLTNRLDKKPGGLIIISPACGLENGKNRDIRLSMEKIDPFLTVKMNDTIAQTWCRNIPLISPDISPEYIDYTGFPPMYFLYGEHELFYYHVKKLLAMLKDQKIVFKEECKPMCHDWALCGMFPEGRRAIKNMSRWIYETREFRILLTGHSVATWKDEDIPCVCADFSKVKAV